MYFILVLHTLKHVKTQTIFKSSNRSPRKHFLKSGLVRDTANSPFCESQRKDVKSDWLAGQLDERSVLGHAQINKGRTKGDDPEIDTAQTPKRFNRNMALGI